MVSQVHNFTDSAMVTSITSGRLVVFKKPFASHSVHFRSFLWKDLIEIA